MFTGNAAHPRYPLVILWSPPRCRSTAFLRMMSARGDFSVVHEPFSHLKEFGVADVLGERLTNERDVIDTLFTCADRFPVFVKDTTDFHYPGVLEATDFLTCARHSIIVRHPREAIASHYRLNPDLSCEEVGFARVREIHDVAVSAGNPPVVVDADYLVDQPEVTVRAYCRALEIPFLPDALAWQAEVLQGWQKTLHWHTEVAESTGFARSAGSTKTMTEIENHPVLGDFYRHHLPHYQTLLSKRLPVQSL